MCLTEKETSLKEAMRAGEKMERTGLVHIISISSGRIGIGQLSHPSEIGRQTINRRLNTVELILYLATMQFWDSTGKESNLLKSIRYMESKNNELMTIESFLSKEDNKLKTITGAYTTMSKPYSHCNGVGSMSRFISGGH